MRKSVWKSSKRHVALRVALVIGTLNMLACPSLVRAEIIAGRPVEPAAVAFADTLARTETVPVVQPPPLAMLTIIAEDEVRERAGLAPRFAIPSAVFITPKTDGKWERVGRDTLVWRLRVSAPGAKSLNLGFTRYFMPESGRLLLYSPDHAKVVRPFTSQDNAQHGELWTPILLGDELVIEVTVPVHAKDALRLELTSINVGYRGFEGAGILKSGVCNIDVVCPEGNDWWDEIPSVGVISTGGSTFCTGFMVNNTAQDQTPYFQTAYHCGIRSTNAASLVVYWNYETSTCGGTPDGSLSDFQTGSYFRAEYSTSDFTLVEMDEDPDPTWGVTFAGWDRSGADATTAIAIHHPSTDEKRISFEYDSTTITSYLGTSIPGDGTHVRVIDWDLGTTEGGSSGSPLFDQNHRVIGQLHGGYAACGNDLSDWYGRVYVSWTGGGSSATRLRDWLDPGNTGAMSVDSLVPGAVGLKVTPFDSLDSSGDAGGPFAPGSKVYTLENQNDTPIDYTVSKGQAWVSLSDTGGTLPGLGSTTVTVSINSNANGLSNGTYTDTVAFTNTTDHEGDTVRGVTLTVGVPSVVYEWTLDTAPGWSTEGLWAFGQPTGGGGQYGSPDPSSGYTGTNVYGYNLAGDYENSLPERHLTTAAIDCSDLSSVSLKFQRWLGVEQPTYDHAYVRVSNNGSSWTTVWENTAEVADSAWSLQDIDISAIADNQPTVYVRWTMGVTDGSWQYCGWNIDDVQIWAIDVGTVCTDDPDCDDGLYCNGAETCVTGACQPGTPIDCGDGVVCTDDSCNEATDSCDNVPNDGNCDNGQYCDGAEWCDAVGGCQPGTAVDCDDAVACTVDGCNDATDSCDNIPDDGLCDDGLFCNGAEVCDTVADCQAGADPCPGEDCDEVDDVCIQGACDSDGTCESGEDCITCPADCISGGGSAVCGNGVCESASGEDCLSCASDCNGKQVGATKRQFCCGDGDGTNPVDCTDPRCSEDTFVCSDTPADPYCCGDGTCEGVEDGFNCEVDCGPPPVCGDLTCDPGEDQCDCPEDCGTPPAIETDCADGIDNDCDGFTDGDDSDCACLPKGDPCTLDAECCSNWCHRGACK